MKFANFKKSISIVLLCAATTIFSLHCFPLKMIVDVPITDLRIEPKSPPNSFKYPIFYKNNPLQDSQLLLGEHILALEENDGWLKIQALEQRKLYSKIGWSFQTGFIKAEHAIAVKKFEENNIVVKNQWANIYTHPGRETEIIFSVSIGTKLLSIDKKNDWHKIKLPDGRNASIHSNDVYHMTKSVKEDLNDLRTNLTITAETFLNIPYSWGGRSSFNPDIYNQQTGVDCSSFVNLVYRANGLQIPRDTADQYLLCRTVKNGKNLKPGDLIFFANKLEPKKIHHVLMYMGQNDDVFNNGVMIESTGSRPGWENKITYDRELFGKQLSEIDDGDICEVFLCGTQVVYFGTYTKNQHQVKHLRLESLRIDADR